MNYKWYTSIFKGKYNIVRIAYTALNFLTLVSFICLFASSVILSDCFGLIVIKSGKAFGRLLHLLSAYWGFAFISMHLGLHWGAFCKTVGKIIGASGTHTAILRVTALLIAVIGAYVFVKNDVFEYMTLRKQFVNFNLRYGEIVFFAEHIAMSGLWIFISHYLLKTVREKKLE